MKHLLFFMTMIILLTALIAMGQIPQTISYQGVLTDNSGTMVANGDYSILFQLYNVSASGSPLWTETQTVTISDGIFNVKLGALNPLNLSFDTAYWLAITIDGGSELSPRIELTSSAYSLKSNSVTDSSITAASVATGQIVRSINSLKDDIIVTGKDNILVSQNGDTLIISATGTANGDITAVNAGNGLTGGGTNGDISLAVLGGTGIDVGDSVLLDIAYTDGRFVNEAQANSVTSAMILDGTVSSNDIADNSITAAKISPNMVSSIDGVSNDGGNIDLVAGSNISVTPDDANNTITISSSGGTGGGDITAVNVATGLTGGGTTGDVTLNHADMSTQNSVDNSSGTVVQDIAVGSLGHLTGITSYNLDDRYFTETESDGRFVNEAQTNSVTSAMITDGAVGNTDLANNAVTAAKISPNIVSSIAGVNNDGGNVDLVAGSNITITPDDANNQITFSANASNLWNLNGSDIYYNSGNVGIGSSSAPYPLTLYASTSNRGLSITHNQTGTISTEGINLFLNRTGVGNASAFGIRSTVVNDNGTFSTRGIYATAGGNATGPKHGVFALAQGAGTLYGVKGVANSLVTSPQYGIWGEAIGSGTGVHYGVYGTASGGGTLWSGYFTGNVYAGGNLGVGTTTPTTPLEVAGTIQSSSGGFMFPDGSLQTSAAIADGNTLDAAYDEGGAGAGRTITADAGAFEINGVDGALFTGTFDNGVIPAEGAGPRMMWYPRKAAFRAGIVYGAEWDDDNVGDYSVAMGEGTTASGQYSTALGYRTTASGQISMAMGSQTNASGDISTAIGAVTTASGLSSTAIGSNTIASGRFSTAMGRYVVSSGDGSFTIGDQSPPPILNNSTANRFMTRFAGGYYLYTNSTSSLGAALPASSNSWVTVSDSTKKENLKEVNGEEILAKISRIKLSTWNYIGQDPGSFRHYGPMAQDFFAAFGHDGIGTIGNDTTLSSADFDGINFIAIQTLEKRTTELIEKTNEIEKLRNDLLALKEENSALKQKLVNMETDFKEFEAFMINSQNQDKQTNKNISLANLK